MNRSALLVAPVPPGPVTVMDCARPRWLTALTCAGGHQKLAAAVAPKSTAVTPVNPLPSMVTSSCPTGPLAGVTEVTVGTPHDPPAPMAASASRRPAPMASAPKAPTGSAVVSMASRTWAGVRQGACSSTSAAMAAACGAAAEVP
jgi:hypothetical protein